MYANDCNLTFTASPECGTEDRFGDLVNVWFEILGLLRNTSAYGGNNVFCWYTISSWFALLVTMLWFVTVTLKRLWQRACLARLPIPFTLRK